MQEIIPFLVESWKDTSATTTDTATNTATDTFVVDVDEVPVRQYLNHLIAAENIVLTCFTPALYKVAQFARDEVNQSARFIVHLHNQSTIACWPLRHWSRADFFRKSDVFVSSCNRDAQCLKKTYPQAQTEVIPFSYKQLPQKIKSRAPTKTIPFAFIGRISSQKNLHTLFLGLHHFQIQNPEVQWTLDIFGKEDGLGSPNMGFEDSGYENYLKTLASELNINSKIKFQGFQDRSSIQKFLDSKKIIFVAPSLHSDENFGMAAFQCLINGHLAVLSDWGGHTDFGEYFQKQTLMVQVYKSKRGPFINPLELAAALKNASTNYSAEITGPIPEYYHFDSIKAKNAKILNRPIGRLENLKATAEADQILLKVQSQISKQPGKQDQKIFDSYEDPSAHLFFEAYGMQKNLHSKGPGKNKVPWIKVKENRIIIEDPHRGHFEVTNNSLAEVDLFESGYRY